MRKKPSHPQPKASRSYLHRIPSSTGKMQNLLIQREYLLVQLAEVERQMEQETPNFNLCWEMEEDLNGM